MAASRTFINVNWSLQRGDHGEQPIWAAIALASVLGQVGLPGEASVSATAAWKASPTCCPTRPSRPWRSAAIPVRSFIPVARIADLLLNPGQPFQYDGQDLVYPDIDLVYWCGGNPFHHHQDLNRLIRAWRRPRRSLSTIRGGPRLRATPTSCCQRPRTLERDDIGASARDRFIIAMKHAIAPVGEARDDFEIFGDLADRFGTRESFTEGRTTMEWLRHIYEKAREAGESPRGSNGRRFDEFWRRGYLEIPAAQTPYVLFEEFRMNPDANPLPTPSGRIEIFSEKIASYNYADCPGHPTWLEPAEWLGSAIARTYPLHLLTTQPAHAIARPDGHGARQPAEQSCGTRADANQSRRCGSARD